MGVERCEHALNPSKHLPVAVDINVSTERAVMREEPAPQNKRSIAWHRVNENHKLQYQRKLVARCHGHRYPIHLYLSFKEEMDLYPDLFY